jgi:hypothetical protein
MRCRTRASAWIWINTQYSRYCLQKNDKNVNIPCLQIRFIRFSSCFPFFVTRTVSSITNIDKNFAACWTGHKVLTTGYHGWSRNSFEFERPVAVVWYLSCSILFSTRRFRFPRHKFGIF